MKTNRHFIIILTIIGVILIGGGLLYWKGLYRFNSQVSTTSSTPIYMSKDLKISFQYLKNWYVDEKNFDILIASYKTKLGENSQPTSTQIKISIDKESLCPLHKTIEDNLIYSCGQYQPVLNKILSKEIKEVQSGTFHRYLVQYPSVSQTTFYFLQKDDRILQISKQPDPSQFESEFEEIINSIKFLE